MPYPGLPSPGLIEALLLMVLSSLLRAYPGLPSPGLIEASQIMWVTKTY